MSWRETTSDCVSWYPVTVYIHDCESYPKSEPDRRDERQRNWEWMFSEGTLVRWLCTCVHMQGACTETRHACYCSLCHAHEWLHFLHIYMCTCMACEPSRRALHVEKIHELQDNVMHASCMQLRTCKRLVVFVIYIHCFIWFPTVAEGWGGSWRYGWELNSHTLMGVEWRRFAGAGGFVGRFVEDSSWMISWELCTMCLCAFLLHERRVAVGMGVCVCVSLPTNTDALICGVWWLKSSKTCIVDILWTITKFVALWTVLILRLWL